MPKGVFHGGVLGTLVLVLIAGCGNGTVSKEEYVSRLNAMCEDFSAREKVIGDPNTIPDLVEKGPRVLDAFETAIVDKIHQLTAPSEIADQANRLVNLANEQRDVLARLVAAARDDDVALVLELASKNDALNEEAASITRELGAEACAEQNRSRP